jgi:hypothetical protein
MSQAHHAYLPCINPECRRPMRMVDWRPGFAAFWECEPCRARALRGRKLLEGSYDGRLMMAPAYAREDPRP